MIARLHAFFDHRHIGLRVNGRGREDIGKITLAHVVRATAGDEDAFGLYQVDYTTYARTANEGTDVMKAIATGRILTHEQRALHGGTGPMSPEPDHMLDTYCRKE